MLRDVYTRGPQEVANALAKGVIVAHKYYYMINGYLFVGGRGGTQLFYISKKVL